MDEEDGRPGALAAQRGRPDARKDALPRFLRSAGRILPQPIASPSNSFQEDSRGIYPGMVQASSFVTGHDFSHAAHPTRQSRALAPVFETPPHRTPHIPENTRHPRFAGIDHSAIVRT